MVISVISKKGGVGKTPFAFSIAKDLNMYLQSNDNSCIEHIYPNKAKISQEVKLIDNCVYDFGGFVAKGILNIVEKSNYIIIPTNPNLNSIIRTYETYNELKEFNKNFIILATGFKDNKEVAFLIKNLKKIKDCNIPIFYFKDSKIVLNSMNYGKSFNELYKENTLSMHSYKNFIKSYYELLKYIKNNKLF